MKRQFLEDLNIEKEAIDSIMAEYGKEIKDLKDKNAQLKVEYNELNEKYKDIDFEELESYKAKYDDLVAQNEKDAAERAFNNLLSDSFKKFNVKDNKAVKVHLDIDKIKEAKDDDEKMKIMEQQLTDMKKDKDYLFNVETESKPIFTYSPQNGNDSIDSANADIINAIKGIF